MNNEIYEPTKAEMLASLLTGNANMVERCATVQRSHRFPLHYFVQIESMAKAANVPVSLIINQLIGCGLDAVTEELPEDVVKKLTSCTREQFECPTKEVTTTVKGRNLANQKMPNSGQ